MDVRSWTLEVGNAGKMIKSFTDLEARKESHKLVLMIYDTTDNFPSKEQFVLGAQIRRAAISVTSNIAEGFGRSTTKDKKHFFTMASGSIYEVKNQLIIARDRGYMPAGRFAEVAEQANCAHQILHGLLRAHKQ